MTTIPDWISDYVSRETFQLLTDYADLIVRWNPTINLVSPNDIENLWERHIWDCAQIVLLPMDTCRTWVDIGTGGGLPGIVVAVLRPDRKIVLVESDKRKAAFLQTVAATLKLNVEIKPQRIESTRIAAPDVISARAFTKISELLDMTQHLGSAQTTYLLPKGETWKQEVEIAAKTWHFTCRAHNSKTNSKAAVIELNNVHKK